MRRKMISTATGIVVQSLLMSAALVAGWFTFEYMGATAGDLLAAEVDGKLAREGHPRWVALEGAVGALRVALEEDDPGAAAVSPRRRPAARRRRRRA